MAETARTCFERLSLAERIGQLNLLSAGEGPDTGSPQSRNIRARLEAGELGALFGTKSVTSVRAWQDLAMASPPHVPLLFAEDVIHGHRTIFPLPIALASAWDPGLWRETARVAAREASAEGIAQVYAPMVDIARDPRWGRIAESPGEDPVLASAYAAAMVEGFQGGDLAATDTVAACLKHFVAYGAARGGRDYDGASLDPAEAIGIYAAPFAAGVAAGAASVMAAFNVLNGTPMHAHRALLDGWLRGVAGFSGPVVADYTGVRELMAHGLGDRETVVVRALVAGVDLDMVGEDYLACLPALAEAGLERPEAGLSVSAAEIRAAIDNACLRVLTLKERLGLLADPFRYCDEARAAADVLTPAHRALARRAAAESCVLLKNDGPLPLSPSASVALVGALADDRANMLGTWAVSGDPALAVTLREGLAACHAGKVTCCWGADLTDDPELAARDNVHGRTVRFDGRSPDLLAEEAADAARAADVCICVVGEAKERSGEASSVTLLELSPGQQRLVHRLSETGTPLVLVVLAGRPLALEQEATLADAVLYGWFGGTEAGHGVADALTGRAVPGGRLPVSLPARTGQVPALHASAPTGRPWPGGWKKFRTGYIDTSDSLHPAAGLFPFGHGLGYARVDWGPVQLSADRLEGLDAHLSVGVRLANRGERESCEVVQLYLSDPVAQVSRPERELKRFKKVRLGPGEDTTVVFDIGHHDLAYPIGERLGAVSWVADPGTFLVHVGRSARDVETRTITWTW